VGVSRVKGRRCVLHCRGEVNGGAWKNGAPTLHDTVNSPIEPPLDQRSVHDLGVVCCLGDDPELFARNGDSTNVHELDVTGSRPLTATKPNPYREECTASPV
jgi:hypothetical protein